MLVWASLKTLPVLWPVLVAESDEASGKIVVFCNSDNAILKLNVSKLTVGTAEELYEKGKRLLERRKRYETLDALEEDVAWAKTVSTVEQGVNYLDRYSASKTCTNIVPARAQPAPKDADLQHTCSAIIDCSPCSGPDLQLTPTVSTHLPLTSRAITDCSLSDAQPVCSDPLLQLTSGAITDCSPACAQPVCSDPLLQLNSGEITDCSPACAQAVCSDPILQLTSGANVLNQFEEMIPPSPGHSSLDDSPVIDYQFSFPSLVSDNNHHMTGDKKDPNDEYDEDSNEENVFFATKVSPDNDLTDFADDTDDDVIFIRKETKATLKTIFHNDKYLGKKMKVEDEDQQTSEFETHACDSDPDYEPVDAESEICKKKRKMRASSPGSKHFCPNVKKSTITESHPRKETKSVAGCPDEEENEHDEVDTCSFSEQEILRDFNIPAIYIRRVLKSYTRAHGMNKKKNNRVITSQHACSFCDVIRTHIQDHLLRRHSNEPDVQRIKNMLTPVNDEANKEVKLKKLKYIEPYMDLLRAMGDNKHNKKVVEDQKGQMLLYRRPTSKFDHREYAPCPKCLLWLLRHSLPKHQKTCPGHKIEGFTERVGKRDLLMQSDILLGKISVTASPLLRSEVFAIMYDDEVARISKNDCLIIALGETWLRRCISNELKRKYFASQHMRLAAKLLIDARRIAHEVKIKTANASTDTDRELQFWDLLRPAYFKVLLKASLSISIPEIDDEEMLKSPSNAIKIKYDIIRMAQSKKVISRAEFDKDRTKTEWKVQREEAKELLDDVQEKWSEMVTRQARKVLAERRLNRVHTLPKPQDIQKLSKYLVAKLTETDLSEDVVTWKMFRDLTKYAQTRLLLYNKRRSGELEAILLKSYVGRRSIADIDAGIMGDLNVTEKYLLESQDLVETRGKQNRPVPVLIPQDCQKPLNFLANLSVRKSAGISEQNKYLFPNLEQGVISSYVSLKQVCSECDLQTPDRITRVAMRKYMATLSQVLNMKSNELDWVCRHLGHNKEHYRHTSPLIERINIGKILVMQDLNVQDQYVGKSLDTVDFSDILNTVDNDGQFVDQAQSTHSMTNQTVPLASMTNQNVNANDDGNHDEDDQDNIGESTSNDGMIPEFEEIHRKRDDGLRQDSDGMDMLVLICSGKKIEKLLKWSVGKSGLM